jgi:itaconyl-CoA hydratase
VPEPDFTTFPLRPRGNRFEDFAEGQVFEHHWGRTLTESDNVLFATTTLAYCPLYTNADYARRHDHPTTPLHPLLVLCTVLGLSVEDLSEAGGPFLGMEKVRFHRPLYPGDTIEARSRVIAKRTSDSRPAFGIVTWHTEAFDQEGRLVVDYERSNLVARRRPGSTGGDGGDRG